MLTCVSHMSQCYLSSDSPYLDYLGIGNIWCSAVSAAFVRLYRKQTVYMHHTPSKQQLPQATRQGLNYITNLCETASSLSNVCQWVCWLNMFGFICVELGFRWGLKIFLFTIFWANFWKSALQNVTAISSYTHFFNRLRCKFKNFTCNSGLI